jgi:hypothetical protein
VVTGERVQAKPVPQLVRGTVFRAEHDDSFEFWNSSDPRSKLCLTFNLTPPTAGGDVHYFLATSKVSSYRENPSILSDTFIISPGRYAFFPDETLIDFRTLCVVPMDKLIGKRLEVKGELSKEDLAATEKIVGVARILENRAKKLLGLR